MGNGGVAHSRYRSALVELAHQRQRERRAHVLEVRTDFQTDAVPAWIAFDVADGNLRLTQWATATHTGGGVIHVGHVLANPGVEFGLQVATLFPGADVFALDDLDVMGQATDHKDVRQLGAQLVVQLGFLAFFVIAEELGLLARVDGEERRVIGVLAHGQRDKPLLGQLELAALGNKHFGRDLGLGFAHGLVVVDRQITDGAAALWTNDVGAPAVLGKAVGQATGKGKRSVAPQEVLVAATDVLVVAERLGGDRVFAIGRAQHEVRQCQANETRVVAFTKGIPFGELRPLEDGLQILEVGQVGKAVDAEELWSGRGDEGRVGHRRNRGDRLQQLHVLRAGVELVVTDDRAERLAAELAELGGVHRLVQTRTGDLRGILEIFEQLLFGHAEDFQLVVLAKIRAVDQKLQRAPGRFQLLELLVVNDRVDLPAQLGIQRGDHVVDQPGADLLGLPGRLEQFGDKRFEALTGDGISLVARLDARRFHQLIQQGNRLDRLAGRARCLTLFFAHGLFLVLYAKFREQTLAGPVIVHQGLQLLAKLRQVTHRPFQGLERIGEVVFVDADRFEVFNRRVVFTQGEVADHQLLERQLDLFLRAAGVRAVNNIDALFRRDRTFTSH